MKIRGMAPAENRQSQRFCGVCTVCPKTLIAQGWGLVSCLPGNTALKVAGKYTILRLPKQSLAGGFHSTVG